MPSAASEATIHISIIVDYQRHLISYSLNLPVGDNIDQDLKIFQAVDNYMHLNEATILSETHQPVDDNRLELQFYHQIDR